MKKIKFHFTYYIVAISFLLTGQFANILVITSLIIIHELGHYFACKSLKVNVDKIVIYSYGGLTKINDLLDINLDKELLISVSGITLQSIYFLFIFILYKNNLIRTYIFNLFFKYHYSMLIFNLIPIYPLDGFKILNIIINKIFNIKLSNLITIIISVINLILILFIYKFNYSYLMIMGILLDYLYKYISNYNYLYNRFLLEKYLYKPKYTRKRIINDYKKMYRNTNHLIKKTDKYATEEDFLNKMFDLK